ncbi:TPA: 3D domain-containing protein [Klebsiella michiganensis]|uniref:3D domain-containing protein n=1 Tax=Klebsiella TaxID=570 RepID=UPI001D185AC9|nr:MULTISPECIES: 3D domain-containing protein [Klebsiella]MDU3357627.1 3D domain-containing protein [Klebsiella sp.]
MSVLTARHVTVYVFILLSLSSISFLLIANSELTSKKNPMTFEPINDKDSRYLFDLPPPTNSQIEGTIRVAATRYYDQIVPPSIAEDSIPYRDMKGNPVSDRVSPYYWCLGAIEGSISTTFNGKPVILNYHDFKRESKYHVRCTDYIVNGSRDIDGDTRYKITNAKYGKGVNDWFLVPYRTIATDPLYIKHGEVIYIEKARGQNITLPSGKVVKHDGYFFAGDRGARDVVKGKLIDVFCGFDSKCLSKQVTISTKDDLRLIDAKVINDQSIKNRFKQYHLKE